MLAPTRELAQQIHEVLEKACVPANLKTCCVFGGVDKSKQVAVVRKGEQIISSLSLIHDCYLPVDSNIHLADIIVATPGRLIDLIQDESADLKNVKYLVFDEADRMLDMGFIPQIRAIVDTIPKDADRYYHPLHLALPLYVTFSLLIIFSSLFLPSSWIIKPNNDVQCHMASRRTKVCTYLPEEPCSNNNWWQWRETVRRKEGLSNRRSLCVRVKTKTSV